MYQNTKVDSCDFKAYPLVGEDDMKYMSDVSAKFQGKTIIFPYARMEENGFIDVYIWNVEGLENTYRRFVLCQGMIVSDVHEREYLDCIDDFCIDRIFWKKFCESMYSEFPQWYFVKQYENLYYIALEHIYYVSRRCGCKEILYKAGLYNIAYYIDELPEYNIIGNTPQEIIGHDIPLRLLRVLNNSNSISYLCSEDEIELCKKTYKKYADYITDVNISKVQWEYLAALTSGKYGFKHQAFSRKLYNMLADINDKSVLYEYGKYLTLRSAITVLPKRKLPRHYEIREQVYLLEKIYYSDTYTNFQIAKRKDENQYLEYNNGCYTVMLPENSKDVYLEALCQNNCLGNYVNSYSEGNEIILFIRKVNNPSKPFYTMEIFEGCINQVLGKNNCIPNLEILKFLEEYAMVKGLEYNPMHLFEQMPGDYDYTDDKDIESYIEGFKRRCLPLCFEVDENIAYEQLEFAF